MFFLKPSMLVLAASLMTGGVAAKVATSPSAPVAVGEAPSSASAPASSRAGRGAHIERRLERMKERLELSDAQVEEIRVVLSEAAQQPGRGRGQGSEHRAARAAQAQQIHSRINAILSAEQRERLQAMRAERAAARATKKAERQANRNARQGVAARGPDPSSEQRATERDESEQEIVGRSRGAQRSKVRGQSAEHAQRGGLRRGPQQR